MDSSLLAGVRAVVFDAVGTLIFPNPAPFEIYAAVGQRHGSRLDRSEIQSRFKHAFAHEEQRDRSTGFKTSENREVERWRSIVVSVLSDVRDQDSCFRELWAHFARPTSWKSDPQVQEVLQRLRQLGVTSGMASNFDGRLRSILAGMPELAELSPIVISSEIGWRKPAEPFFASVCRQAGLRPEQILFVGDDLTNDFEGARQAGLRAVLLNRSAKGDAQVTNAIDELIELI